MHSDLNMVDAYRNNRLIEACGPLRDNDAIARGVTYLPKLPKRVDTTLGLARVHQLQVIKDLHVCSPTDMEIAETIDIMLRQGYVKRLPSDPGTWTRIYATAETKLPSVTPLGAAIRGISGVGKTRTVDRILSLYPQVVEHPRFPNIVGRHKQILYLKINVPHTGKAGDLARALMSATSAALNMDSFPDWISPVREVVSSAALDAWKRRACVHFLGLLWLDEIQNLFRISSVKTRRSNRSAERPLLRVADDGALKFLLTFLNTSNVPVLCTGTPDGIEALQSRLATAQRFSSAGYHELLPAQGSNDIFFSEYLLPQLERYQWLPQPLAINQEVRELIFKLSAGIPRIYIDLWAYAQRQAIRRESRALEVQDIMRASQENQKLLRDAINVILSDDPHRFSRYEDLIAINRGEANE